MKDINQESVTQCGRGSKKTPDYWSLKNSKLPRSNKHVYLKQVSVKVFHLNMCVRLYIVDICERKFTVGSGVHLSSRKHSSLAAPRWYCKDIWNQPNKYLGYYYQYLGYHP